MALACLNVFIYEIQQIKLKFVASLFLLYTLLNFILPFNHAYYIIYYKFCTEYLLLNLIIMV